eukprot:TRINITY_DN20741_c0_g1_i3.p1 TRINITY_DN20741_c0_g1~~TRINITY_DN20741_c0_g1_i3.p1  ORF type:complete len:337 (-),score=39.60 TRINITY_DN20741_c0_g1_i3:9-1019(-)
MQEGALRSEQSLFAAFRAFDRDNSGKISKHEFGRVIELSPACVSELKGKLKRRIGGKAASADEDYEETIDVEHVEDEEEEAATRLDFERKLRNGNRTCDTCHSNVTGMSYWHCGGCDDTVCIMCLRRAEASAEPCCPDCATDALMLRTYQAPDCTDACRFRHREGCIGCGRHSTLEGRSECAICDAMLCIACIYAYEGDGGMVPVCRACAEDEWCKGGRVMTWRRQFERLVNVFDYGSGEHLGVSTYYHDSMSATEVARLGRALRSWPEEPLRDHQFCEIPGACGCKIWRSRHRRDCLKFALFATSFICLIWTDVFAAHLRDRVSVCDRVRSEKPP